MKTSKLYLRVLMILVSFIMLFSLTACSGGVSSSEAKETIAAFLEAIEEGEYAEAASLCHPDAEITTEVLKSAFQQIETQYGIDINTPIEIQQYTGFYTTFYNSKIGGSAYELSFEIEVEEEVLGMTIMVMRNKNGYGIGNISWGE